MLVGSWLLSEVLRVSKQVEAVTRSKSGDDVSGLMEQR